MQGDRGVREEIAALLDTLMLHILSSGEFKTAAFLLRETSQSAERAPAITPEQKDQLLRIRDRLSDPEVLAQLLQSLDEASQLPDQEDLNEMFDQLRVSALGTVFSWVTKVQTPRLRVLLENAAARLAMANTAELVRLITSTDRDVAPRGRASRRRRARDRSRRPRSRSSRPTPMCRCAWRPCRR